MGEKASKGVRGILARGAIVIAAASMLTLTFASFARADEAAKGAVVLDCGWTPISGVSDCRLISESPAGLGLGAAAISQAEGFNMISGYQPPLQNGRFQIRIGVKLPEQGADNTAAPHTPAG